MQASTSRKTIEFRTLSNLSGCKLEIEPFPGKGPAGSPSVCASMTITGPNGKAANGVLFDALSSLRVSVRTAATKEE